jgi:ABC-type cobalamin/Fe3+-siderophores transport system ATPase subunit
MPLTAERVSYVYRRSAGSDAVAALRDVSVRIAPGSLTGLLGPNGCGKTTLLTLLSGVSTPHEGGVTLDGRRLAALSRRAVARRIAVVPQETHPAFDYTVIEMVLMGRHPHLGALRLEGPDDVSIAQEALAATGTSHLAHRAFVTLSGGEKQRVVIAGALAQAPDILLLDEPTASLDPDTADWVRSFLADYARAADATFLIASHNMPEVERLCDRVLMMRAGRIVDRGSPQELLGKYGRSTLEEVFLDVARARRAS